MGVRAEFSDDLDPKTVTPATFTVENVSGLPTYDPSARAVTFRPEDPFRSSEIYTAVLSAEIRSSHGVPLGQSLRWQFACLDRTPPVVVARWPVGEDVSTMVQPGIRFSEPVDVSTLVAENVRIEGVESTLNYDPSTRTVMLVPRRPLYPGRVYTGHVSERVRDLAGNALGAPVSWTFRTRAPLDDWAVRLVTPPIPEAAPCDTAIELRLRQSFEVDVSALETSPVMIEGIDDGENLSVSYDAARRIVRVLSPTPLRSPLDGAPYRIFATGTLRDRTGDRPFDAGSPMAVIRTVADCAQPTVASVEQAEGILSCDGSALLRFTHPMEEVSTSAALALRNLTEGGYDPDRAPLVPVDVAFSEDGRIVAVTPEAFLIDGHRYALYVTADALDAEGTALAAPGTWEFTARCGGAD